MGILSRAQNFEDVMLWRALGCVENGFFIDIGAQHPIKDSVSKVFSEHGWRGIHVDPVPEYASLLREDRPGDIVIQAAVANQAGLVEFFAIPQTGLSTGNAQIASAHEAAGFTLNQITVPTVSLDELFALANGEVHWLKIDVEGMEADVLNSWRESGCRPWIVLIEANLPGSQVASHEKWEALITAKDYTPVYYDGLNRFYVSHEHPELARSFAVPPNVFDGFQLDTLSDHAIELQRSYGAQIEALSHDVTRLEGDLACLRNSHEASREEWEATTERRLAELSGELSANFEAQQEIAQKQAECLAEEARQDERSRAAETLTKALETERAIAAAARENDQHRTGAALTKALEAAEKAKTDLAEAKMEIRVQSAAAEVHRQQERTVHMANLAEKALRLEFAEHRALTLEGALAQVKRELSELRRKADRNATRLAAKIIAVTEDLALIKQERLYLERQLANEAESARMAQADARNALIKVQEDLAESIDKAERQRHAHRAAVAALSDRHNDAITNQAVRHHEEMSRLQAARDDDASAHAAQIREIEAREHSRLEQANAAMRSAERYAENVVQQTEALLVSRTWKWAAALGRLFAIPTPHPDLSREMARQPEIHSEPAVQSPPISVQTEENHFMSCKPARSLVELLARPAPDFIAGCYRLVLGREPSPVETRGRMTSLHLGISRLTMLADIYASGEAQNARNALLKLGSDEEFIQRLYHTYLARPVDDSGLEHYKRLIQRKGRARADADLSASIEAAGVSPINYEVRQLSMFVRKSRQWWRLTNRNKWNRRLDNIANEVRFYQATGFDGQSGSPISPNLSTTLEERLSGVENAQNRIMGHLAILRGNDAVNPNDFMLHREQQSHQTVNNLSDPASMNPKAITGIRAIGEVDVSQLTRFERTVLSRMAIAGSASAGGFA